MTTRTCAAVLAALSICGCATPGTSNGPRTAGGAAEPCLSAASRIPAGPGTDCIAPGRSYSRTDIDQTGQTTAGGALRDLDPALTINH